MFVDDEEVGTFLYDEGLQLRHRVPDHGEVAGGAREAGPAFHRPPESQARSGPEEDHVLVRSASFHGFVGSSPPRRLAHLRRRCSTSRSRSPRTAPDVASGDADRGGARVGAAHHPGRAGQGARRDRGGDPRADARRRRCSGCTTRACWRCCCPSSRRPSISRKRRAAGTRTSGSTPSRSCGSRCRGRSCAGRRCCTTSARCRRARSRPTGACTSTATPRSARACSTSVARRFGFDRDERQKIRFLILHHLRANQYEPSVDRRGRAPLRPRDGRRT